MTPPRAVCRVRTSPSRSNATLTSTWSSAGVPHPPLPPLSHQRWLKLTELTPFFPARRCQVGQLPVFLRQLDFAVAQAGLSGEAVLGEPPVGRLQRLPVHLELLELITRTRVNTCAVFQVILKRWEDRIPSV